MSAGVKHQHYVPKMYLNRFCKSNGLLYAWDKAESKGRYNSPRAFAQKKYFYDLDESSMLEILQDQYDFVDGQKLKEVSKTQTVEVMLARQEQHIAGLLRRFEEGKLSINDDDFRVPLILFIHSLSVRTPSYRNNIENIHRQIANWLSQFNDGTNPDVNRLCISTTEDYSKETQIRHLVDPYRPLDLAVMLIENYNWYYASVQSGYSKLIISDNPVEMIAHGFNDCCFPISPDKAIIFRAKEGRLISKDTPVDGVIQLSDRSVFCYNTIQYHQANRFVFGDKASIQFTYGMDIIAQSPLCSSEEG